MAELDRSKDFVTIFGGVPDDGAMFVQDGVRFKLDGTPVIPDAKAEVKTASLNDIAEGKTAKKAKVSVKALSAESEEVSGEVAHDIL